MPPDRRLVLLLVSAGVVVVTAAVVLVLGAQRPPALAAVRDGDLAGLTEAVAWTTWGEQTCLHVASPSGEVERPWCAPSQGEVMRWTTDGEVVVRTWDPKALLHTVDPVDGEVTGRMADAPPDPPPGPEPDVLVHDRRDGRLVLRDAASDAVVWQVDAPEHYTVDSSARSADGDWIFAVDSTQRLLVMPADGSAPPRVWAEGVPAWPRPVWQHRTAPR